MLQLELKRCNVRVEQGGVEDADALSASSLTHHA
jgi:hypothetical protein